MLETERCTIKLLQQSDDTSIEKIYMNQEVREFLGGIRTKDSIRATFDEMLNSPQEFYYWVIREKQTKTFIGLVSLDLHHEAVYQEVSYQLLPCWWGKGLAIEVISVVLHFAFNELKLSTVVAETQTANKASCRLLERLGMNLEHTVTRFEAEQAVYSIKNSHKSNAGKWHSL